MLVSSLCELGSLTYHCKLCNMKTENDILIPVVYYYIYTFSFNQCIVRVTIKFHWLFISIKKKVGKKMNKRKTWIVEITLVCHNTQITLKLLKIIEACASASGKIHVLDIFFFQLL